jgi:carbonic anhydrase
MNKQQNSSVSGMSLNRRSFLTTVGVATTAGLLGFTQIGNLAYADALSKTQRDKMTPDEIIAYVKIGNDRFRAGLRKNRDFLSEQTTSAKGQHPSAVVLSCVDSRAPAEIILDLGIGDMFNSRVAGNIVNEDILGSLEFACAVAGSKVLLVMGHTACGAIMGAIDKVQLGNLTSLLEKIRPAIEATQYDGERTSKNDTFVNAVARKNVELTIAGIRAKSPLLKELETKGSIKIVGAMYNLATAGVEFFS